MRLALAGLVAGDFRRVVWPVAPFLRVRSVGFVAADPFDYPKTRRIGDGESGTDGLGPDLDGVVVWIPLWIAGYFVFCLGRRRHRLGRGEEVIPFPFPFSPKNQWHPPSISLHKGIIGGMPFSFASHFVLGGWNRGVLPLMHYVSHHLT